MFVWRWCVGYVGDDEKPCCGSCSNYLNVMDGACTIKKLILEVYR